MADNVDAFGNDITERTNVLDVASHYPYSPERLRLFVDGSRIFPEYESAINDLAQYSHTGNRHELSPAAGETVTLESAERPRYVVGYELAATWAFGTNQSLASGDSIRVGLYDGTDGWYLEHTGDHADDVADLVMESEGSEVYRNEDIDIHAPVTQFARALLQTGWYDITRNKWERSFANGGAQTNPEIGSFSAPDTPGPVTGNLPSHFSVTASGSTTNLVLEAGSFAQVNLGETASLTRSKTPEPFGGESIGSTGTWVPLRAIRVGPDRRIVNFQLASLKVLGYSVDATVTVGISAVPESKVTFDDTDSWSTPPPLTPSSSVVETRSDVTGFPDQTGTVQSSTTTPGPFSLATSTLTPTDTQQFQKGTTSQTNIQKSNLPRDDIAVVIAKADATGDVTYGTSWEEDW